MRSSPALALVTALLASCFFLSALGHPASRLGPAHAALHRAVLRRASTVTAAQLQQIAPTSNTCSGAPAADECRTATQAAPLISQAFSTYAISTPGEMAALIGLMAFETDDFKYDKNHYPGTPGQGTRNMQMITYNYKYAASIPALVSQLQAAAPGGTVPTDPDAQNAVRQLVLTDQYDFGSAAWFLTTQCGPSVRAGLQAGSETGWETYISSCVGTTVTDDRKAYWTRALAALGGSAA
ncbi:MAG: hypothetical protein M4579_000753 [Chaenotheca gracillima]|nr:MAG: hypothetical protein M4579_000753 [Chaenotheca gracillima]